MRILAFAIALFATFAEPARAGDPWGLQYEKVVSMKARVVDLLCTIKADCPAACGGGKRQLGLLTGDGKLLPAVKSATLFAGAALDLLPYCGKEIVVDGLLIENPAMTLYFPQALRESADEPWRPTEAFDSAWTARNGKAEEWFRADPGVKAVIAADGVFGIRGLEPKP